MNDETKTDKTDETPEVPEVAGEAPESSEPVEAAPETEPQEPTPLNGKAKPGSDPFQVGELLPQEVMQLQQVRGRINQHLMEIGHHEVQKAMLLAKLEQLEQQGQTVIRQARLRLGIDDGETIQVTPDGKIRRMPQHPPNVVPMPTPGSGKPPAAG